MASQLLGIKTRFTNDLGSPLVGGQVYTYFAGTSTNQDTYSDAAMTVPNTNPVILDDTGSADIFLKGAYRIRVFDKSGRFIEEQDNVTQVSTGDVTDIQSRLDLVELDTGIVATAKFSGAVTRKVSDKISETISLLDFGAPYATNSATHLQAAIDYLHGKGGGVLKIPYHTGSLKLSSEVVLKDNVVIDCDKNLIIDCTSKTGGLHLWAEGSLGAEIPLAINVDSGANSFTTTAPHGFSVGDDVLIVSQRQCAHEDAGEAWRLGEVTAGYTSPYFAEPLVVLEVISTTKFITTGSLLFDGYRKDKTAETSPTARASTTFQKMNLVTGFKWLGGIFKKENGQLFNLKYTKGIELDITVQRGLGSGAEVYNQYSLSNNIKAVVTRPAIDIDTEGQNTRNSILDVSSWYTNVDLYEENGSQGLDQSYLLYCGLYPTYKVRHINSIRDGATTHGCVYGAVVDIYAVNAGKAAFRNRARFVTGKVKAVNCVWGLANSTWGVVDTHFDVQILNSVYQAVYLLSEGVTQKTPAIKNSSISGIITMSPRNTYPAIEVMPNIDPTGLQKDSNLSFVDLDITSYNLAIEVTTNNHGVTLDNVNIKHYGLDSPIKFQQSTRHRVKGLTVDFKSTDGNVPAIITTGVQTTGRENHERISNYIDYDTCKVINGTLIGSSDNNYIIEQVLNGDASRNSLFSIKSNNIAPLYKVTLTSGVVQQNRIVFFNSIPIGFTCQFIIMTASTTELSVSFFPSSNATEKVFFAEGVVNSGNAGVTVIKDSPKILRMTKIANGEFLIS